MVEHFLGKEGVVSSILTFGSEYTGTNMMKNNNILNVTGTNDFYGNKLQIRNNIIHIIESICKSYNFECIETPAMESLELLKNVYGDEAESLLFYILNSGNFLKDIPLQQYTSEELKKKICTKCLRYDLTLPLMRFIINHIGDITFPFKRYQYQSVWRADRPQMGRYREFLQFDIDIVGTKSLNAEFEIISLINDVFKTLFSQEYIIKLNHRGILYDIACLLHCQENFKNMCILMDKADKIGTEKVLEELEEKLNLKKESIDILRNIFELEIAKKDKIDYMLQLFSCHNIPTNNLEELKSFYIKITTSNIKNVKIDFTLVRGLGYYTGMIFEVILKNYTTIGSVCGGGRYDFFAKKLNTEELCSVGAAFGIDRILTSIEQNPELYHKYNIHDKKKIMFLNYGYNIDQDIISILRGKGYSVEVYCDSNVEIKKQMKYANKKHIDFVILEKDGKMLCKDMLTGENTDFNINIF